MSNFNEGDYIIHKKWKTIGKIVSGFDFDNMRVRKVSTTIGERTHRIGTPYTYQSYTNMKSLKRSWKIISTEDILKILWNKQREN